MFCPSPLQDGDTLALFCPASCTSDTLMVMTADSILRSWGYNTVFSDLIYTNHHGFAGTVEQRKEELLGFLKRPGIKGLFCIRGGWGSIQQMAEIPLDTLVKYPKWLIGFSDVTSMHAVWNAAGIMSIHGPMGGQLKEQLGQDESSLYLKEMLRGKLPEYNVVTHVDSLPMNRPGRAVGKLVGGNVETLVPSMSTPLDYLTTDDDLVLFLEDVGENLSHIERRIVYMKMHGMLSRVRGVICGYFNDFKPDDYDNMEQMLDEYFAPLGIPVVYHFPVGHLLPNYPLLHGAQVEMDVQETSVSLRFRNPW